MRQVKKFLSRLIQEHWLLLPVIREKSSQIWTEEMAQVLKSYSEPIF